MRRDERRELWEAIAKAFGLQGRSVTKFTLEFVANRDPVVTIEEYARPMQIMDDGLLKKLSSYELAELKATEPQ